ncbi:MAG: discoidin domain-containing protein [bacterium]
MHKKLLIFLILTTFLNIDIAFGKDNSMSSKINIALHKSVIGSFEHKTNATDGNNESLATSQDVTASSQYLIIDLGKPYYINLVRIFWDKEGISSNYQIKTSMDFINWTRVAEDIDGTTGEAKGNIIIKDTACKGIAAQYIQLFIPKGLSVVIKEIQVAELQVFPATELNVQIDEITATDITDNSVKILWKTNIETTGQVQYTPAHQNKKNISLSLASETDHNISLKNLLPGTTYYYQITAKDYYGNLTLSDYHTFTTTGIPLPLFSSIEVSQVSETTAVINWITNVPTTSELRYGTDTNYKKGILINKNLLLTHNVELSSLRPSTVYHFEISAKDEFGHRIVSEDITFTTLENNIALKKVVTGTFIHCPDKRYISQKTEFISRVTDGSTSYFTGMATSGDITLEDQYVIIDLGKKYPIDKIVAYWRSLAYSQDYTIKVSLDGSDWTIIDTGISGDDGVNGRSDTGDPMKIVSTPCDGVEAQYVQLFIAKGSVYYHKHEEWRLVQLMELKVYGIWKGGGE